MLQYVVDFWDVWGSVWVFGGLTSLMCWRLSCSISNTGGVILFLLFNLRLYFDFWWCNIFGLSKVFGLRRQTMLELLYPVDFLLILELYLALRAACHSNI